MESYKSAIARATQDNAFEVDCLSDLNCFLIVSLWSRGTIHHRRSNRYGYKRVFETTCWFSFFLRDFFGQRLTHFHNDVVPLKSWILILCLGRIFISVTSKSLDWRIKNNCMRDNVIGTRSLQSDITGDLRDLIIDLL